MSPHKIIKRPQQRVPLTLYDDDCTRLLQLKHKLEIEANKPIQTSEIFRLALRKLAEANNIVIN